MQVYPAPRGRGPYGIEATPGGDVYYASLAGSHIARIDAAGTQTGGERASKTLALHRRIYDAAPDARCVIAGLEATTAEWSGAAAPADDVTFLVLRAV